MEPEEIATVAAIEETAPSPVEVKPPEATELVAPEKKKRKKKKKTKRDPLHPKFPKNGYVRYCDFMRPQVCEENKKMDPVEVTKMVAAKWYALSTEDKKPFLDEAKLDKERFDRELKEFNITLNPEEGPPSKKKSKVKESKMNPKPSTSPVPHPPSTSTSTSNAKIPHNKLNGAIVAKENIDAVFGEINSPGELPIFTDSFLDHNKLIENELKLLRKNCIEIEQDNSVLLKHVENMENGVLKVNGEIVTTRHRNAELEFYLTRLRCILAASFHSLTEPSIQKGATVENINEYMAGLKASSPTILIKASDIIRKMDIKFNVDLKNFQH